MNASLKAQASLGEHLRREIGRFHANSRSPLAYHAHSHKLGCTCGAQAHGNKDELIEAILDRMPNANAGARAAFRAMKTSDLEHMLQGLPEGGGSGLRIHTRSDDEDVQAMAGDLSSFRANQNIGDGGLAPGIIHGRYQDAPPPGRARFHTMSTEEVAESPVPTSSFRPNRNLSGRR